MAKYLWLAVFWVAFLLPFHFFPFQDLPNDLAGMVLVSFCFLITAIQIRHDSAQVPFIVFFLFLLFLSVVVSAYLAGQFVFTDYTYPLFVLSGILVALLVANCSVEDDLLVIKLAKSLKWIAIITALYGLTRHYGLLKIWLPWINYDPQRLIGPLNQANLTALILAFGLVSSCYLLVKVRAKFSGILAVSILLAVAGSLTGSRAFIALVMLIVITPFLKAILSKAWIKTVDRSLNFNGHKLMVLIASVFVIIVVYPKVDKPITEELVERGLIDRVSTETIMDRFSFKDSYRSDEWKKVTVLADAVDNTLVGVGPGRYAQFSINADELLDNPGRMGTLWIHSHNLFINVLVELGYIGLSILILLLSYLVYIFLKAPPNDNTFFLFTILAMLFFNNLIEFSFWFFGFFALAVSVVTLLDEKVFVKPSSSTVPVVIATLVLIIALSTSFYVGRDAWASINGFHKVHLNEGERAEFLSAKRNRFVGGDAFKAQIIREEVSLIGVNAQLRDLEDYIAWRPEMVFLMRRAVLVSILGPQDRACDLASQAVKLFPDVTGRLVDELKSAKRLGATFDIDYIHRCVADGMMYWVGRGKTEDNKK